MRVLVIGGTRGVGHAVVVAGHGAGHVLTVMARNAGGFNGPVSGIRMVVGDAADGHDVERAIIGQDAVVWTVGVAASADEVSVFSRGIAHVLASMRDNGVRRLVCVTGVATGADVSRARMLSRSLVRPALAKRVVEDKARQEALIEASAVDWIIVRPAVLTDGKATGLYQALTGPMNGRPKRIPRADVADFIVDNLVAPDFVRKMVCLTA